MSLFINRFTRIKKEIEDNKKINKTFTEVITHKTRKLEGLQSNKGNN